MFDAVRSRRLPSWFLVAMFVAAARGAATGQDLLLAGGRILTLDPDRPEVEALALRDGVVLALGSERECQEALGGSAPRLDLAGSLLLPGFRDAGVDLLLLGRLIQGSVVDLRGTDSAGEALDRVRDRASTAPPGSWVIAYGLEPETWSEGEWPSRFALDLASELTPTLLLHRRLRVAFANTSALHAAGIDADTPDPPGGRVERDHWGDPTGKLLGSAAALVRDRVPPLPFDERLEALRAATARLSSLGVTAVLDRSTPARTLDVWEALLRGGEMSLRVALAPPPASLDDPLVDAVGRLRRRFPGFLALAGPRIVADGDLATATAWLERPYHDDALSYGEDLLAPEDERAAARARSLRRVPIVVVRGDRAYHDALRRLVPAGETGGRALWLEGAVLSGGGPPPQGARRLGFIATPRASVLPADLVRMRLGADRAARRAEALAVFLARAEALASLAPMVEPDPLADARLASARVGTAAALRQLCVWPADIAPGLPASGPLRPGAPADLVALDGAPAPGAVDLAALTVRWTMLGGRVVYGLP